MKTSVMFSPLGGGRRLEGVVQANFDINVHSFTFCSAISVTSSPGRPPLEGEHIRS